MAKRWGTLRPTSRYSLTGRVPAAILALLLFLALPPSETAAAIAFVTNIGTNGNTTVGTTISVTVPAGGVAVNNAVIVTFAMDPASGTVTVADSRGNVYTSNTDVANGSGTSGVRTVILSTRLTTALLAGDTITVTHPSVTAKAVSVNVFSGLAPTAMLDRSATGTGSSTAPATAATPATTQASELLIGAIGVETNSTETFTPGSLYTALTRSSSSSGNAAGNVAIDPEYQIVNATGSYAATGTLSNSRNWAAAIATYRAAICGNGVIESGEQCDDGTANGTPGDCCSATCQFVAATTVCRAAAGPCDVAETCTGTAAACPANQLAGAGTVCRAAIGPCDQAETCSGTSSACPADQLAAAGTICRAAAGTCDVVETCSGTSSACPVDGFMAAGTVCRAATGVCDLAESCTGTSASCPTDSFVAAGTLCRASAGVCDVAETCTGISGTCPPDGFAPTGSVCRASTAPCDIAETCTGTSVACPADQLSPAGIVCRPSSGGCDLAETCTGLSSDCPADAFAASGTVCRASAGVCDVAETCTGSSAACPADAFVAAGTVCRASTGACDVAEACTGSAAACPADQFVSAGTVCRAAVSSCDSAEACTGIDAACPQDIGQPDGTACDDGNQCTLADVCLGGVCTGTSPGLDCPDSFLCYKAKSSVNFTTVPGVHLVDAFDDAYFNVLKPRGLCMPATVNATSVIGPNRRLDGYAMKPESPAIRQTNLKIVNQLGSLVLNTGKPDVVRVPGTLPSPPSTADPNGYVDHYKCYKTFITPGTPKLRPGLQVSVSDQFMSAAVPFALKKPGHLCVPADDNSQGVRDPSIFLLCYKAGPAPGQSRGAPQLGIHLNDEFGAEILNTIKELEVCVPSVRIP